MAKSEHFHQILSKKFLFPLKVGKAKTTVYFFDHIHLHVISSNIKNIHIIGDTIFS